MKDFPIKHVDDADEVNRNIDEQTSGHRMKQVDDADAAKRKLDDSGDESTEGHTLRKRRDLDDAGDESTEGHSAR
jgi:hypothetical protein